MSEAGRCPYCGALAGPARARDDDTRAREEAAAGSLGPLYREVRRLREIAQAVSGPATAARGEDGDARIAELTREVGELRATVARLRGSMGAGVSRVS